MSLKACGKKTPAEKRRAEHLTRPQKSMGPSERFEPKALNRKVHLRNAEPETYTVRNPKPVKYVVTKWWTCQSCFLRNANPLCQSEVKMRVQFKYFHEWSIFQASYVSLQSCANPQVERGCRNMLGSVLELLRLRHPRWDVPGTLPARHTNTHTHTHTQTHTHTHTQVPVSPDLDAMSTSCAIPVVRSTENPALQCRQRRASDGRGSASQDSPSAESAVSAVAVVAFPLSPRPAWSEA